jgi:Xaa-Pro aminopeptidase
MYTRVLIGVLELEKAVWPKNKKFAGQDLDFLARKSLFEVGQDFAHGTGHGIGSMLFVHEGPKTLGIMRNKT